MTEGTKIIQLERALERLGILKRLKHIENYQIWKGTGGKGTDDQTAEEVSYADDNYHNVQDALDSLINPYVNLAITSFTHDAGVQEKGSTLDDFTLNWSYNTPTDPLTSQSLDHGIGSVTPLTKHFYDVTGAGLTAQETYVLTASNGITSPTANATIYFQDKRHWGANTDDDLTSAEILTLDNNEFETDYVQTRTFDCSGGKYIWFAFPKSWGQPKFYVGGFLTNFIEDTISHTNASGYTVDYYTYRSPYQYNNPAVEVEVTS